MKILIRLVRESVIIALQEIISNKLRSFLSLLGVTIGIFCIIAVFSAVDSLRSKIQESFEALGNDILYVQKWPWAMSREYPWWKYVQRPEVDESDLEMIRERSQLTANAALAVFGTREKVQYENRTLERINVVGVTEQYDELRDLDFKEGRFFSEMELFVGKRLIILGSEIAKDLFPGYSEVTGRQIKLKGIDFTVAGVLESEGDFLFNLSLDNDVLIPFNAFKGAFSDKFVSPIILVKTMDHADPIEHVEEIRGIIRQHRIIKPKEDDNFAVNRISIMINQLQQLFGVVNIAGLFIGIFSILVGGFGIANIMFVSVKERTNIIGIKKALGARQLYILLEFLTESVFLCVLGGITGLILVFITLDLIEYVMKNFQDSAFDFFVSATNVLLGLGISIVTGLVFGFIPAYNASRMKPVDAIRMK